MTHALLWLSLLPMTAAASFTVRAQNPPVRAPAQTPGAQTSAGAAAAAPHAAPPSSRAAAPKLAPVPPRFAAGPTYTSADGNNGPAWPKADIVLRNVSIATPGAAHLIQNGLDKGEATTLRRFEEGGYGIEVVMAIDASGSMKGRPLMMLRESLAKFVDEARQQDKVAIATFADDTRWDVPFGSPRSDLQRALNGIEGRGRFTHLYDALLDCLGRFDNDMQRRELIVMSDGHDEGSQHTLDDVITEAKRQNIAIDSIGVTRSSPQFLKNLQAISQATDGSFRAAQTDEELQGFVSHAIGTLKAQPLATFDLAGIPRDGQPHPVQIQVDGAPMTAELTIISPAAGDSGTTAGGSKDRGFVSTLTDRRNLWWVVAIGVLLLVLIVVLVVALTRRRRPREDEFWAHSQQPQVAPPQSPGLGLGLAPAQQGFPPARPLEPTLNQPRPDAPVMTVAQPPPMPLTPRPLLPRPARPVPIEPASAPAPHLNPPRNSGSWSSEPDNDPPDTAPLNNPPPAPIPTPTPGMRSGSTSASARPVRVHTRMVQFFDAKPGQPFARLMATDGPLQGRATEVVLHTLRVGAAPDNDFVIAGDDSLSGHHACLFLEVGIWMIEDLHSTNGTFVNGERISGARRQLAPGDLIGMGRSAFRVDRSNT